jgi:cyanate permease
VSRYFGMRAFGAIFGGSFAAFTLGMATGPLLMGYGHDMTHSYTLPLGVLLGLLCVAVAATAMLPAYDRAIRRG